MSSSSDYGTSKLGSVSESMSISSSSSASYFDSCPSAVTITISGVAGTDPPTDCDTCEGYNRTVNLVLESNCYNVPGYDCCYCYVETQGSQTCDQYVWPCGRSDPLNLAYVINEDGSISMVSAIPFGCYVPPQFVYEVVYYQGTFAGNGKIEKGRTYVLYPVVDNPRCCNYSGSTMEVSFS